MAQVLGCVNVYFIPDGVGEEICSVFCGDPPEPVFEAAFRLADQVARREGWGRQTAARVECCLGARAAILATQLISGVMEAVGVNVAITCFDMCTAGRVRGPGIGGTTEKRKDAGKVALAAEPFDTDGAACEFEVRRDSGELLGARVVIERYVGDVP